MGREAYRMGVRFANTEIPKENVVEVLKTLGAYDTQKGCYGQVDMEIAFEEGFLEILVYNRQETSNIMNKALYLNDSDKHLRCQEKPNITIMEMRFAKANSVDLVDKIMGVIIKLHLDGVIEKVGDLEVRQAINMDDYSEFKERVRRAKKEFESWHQIVPYPIRCNEYYETYHRMYPEEYTTGSTDDFKK